MRRISVILMLVMLGALGVRGESVGLVLSGGGAKGIAHIGFIQALEENDIAIDYVTGTSMGAIVSSLYAMGYTPAEMMELIKSDEFKHWSAGRMPKGERLQYVEPAASPKWVDVNCGPDGKKLMSDVLPTRLINPLPMSMAFLKLYGSATAGCGGDFDRLMVPLRTVASDIYHHRSVVFSHGELADAVRSSMSFPMVFQPIEVNGVLLYDGGLYDVYPVDVMMKDFNPDRVIGANVSSADKKPELNDLIGQLDDMMTDNVDYPFPDDRGVNVRFHLDRFGLLDWGAADEIYSIGYKRGCELADSIKHRVSARRTQAEMAERRARFKASLAPVSFDHVEVEGTTPAKAEYISYLFTGADSGNGAIDMDEAREGFYNVASTGRLRNLVPHAQGDTLILKADVDPDIELAVGGYLTSSAGSMVYGAVKYDPFALYSPGASLRLWVGQNYLEARARGVMNMATVVPSRVYAEVGIRQKRMMETETAFYDFTTPSFLRDGALGVRGGYEMAAGRHGTAGVSVGYAHLTSRYYSASPEAPEDNGRNRFLQDVALIKGEWHHTTLDDASLPTQGARYDAEATLNAGRRHLFPWHAEESAHNRVWLDVLARAEGYLPLSSKVSVGMSGELWWSTRPLMGTDYTASIVNARQFSPLMSRMYIFDPQYRSNQYVAVGLHPVWQIGKMLQLRAAGYLYAPMRRIMPDGGYSPWMDNAEFIGEASVAVKLPFGPVRAYVNYSSTHVDHWGAGVSIGTAF